MNSVCIGQVWQITPVAGIYLLLISPVVHRLMICYGYDYDCTPSIPYHSEQIVWFAASAFFFTAEFPQSLLSPGSCDHFFHGHQVQVPVVIDRCTIMSYLCRFILLYKIILKCNMIFIIRRTDKPL